MASKVERTQSGYDETNFSYDTTSCQNKVTSLGGTITRTVFSVGSARQAGLPTAVYVGTTTPAPPNPTQLAAAAPPTTTWWSSLNPNMTTAYPAGTTC